MATLANNCMKYKIPKFWDDEYKRLDYIQEKFNDLDSVAR